MAASAAIPAKGAIVSRLERACCWILAAALFTDVNQVCAAASPRAFALLRDTMAAQPDPRHGEDLYSRNCSHCHSPGAWGKGAAAVPALAGQRGTAEPPVISFVGGLSERETQAVADYISRLQSPVPGSQRR